MTSVILRSNSFVASALANSRSSLFVRFTSSRLVFLHSSARNMANPRTVFISGANRGIGFELIKQLVQLASPPEIIIATYRKKEDAKALFEFSEKNKSVKPLQLEVRDHSTFPNVVKEVAVIVGDKGLNLLINNAGILDKNQNLMDVTHQQMIDAHEVNVISPLFLTRAFLPLLRAAVKSGSGNEFSWSQSTVINVTSILGSIEQNTSSDNYAYRASKAAINMITKNLSLDLKPDKILVVAVHPGWVQTEMGGPQAPMTVQQSVAAILKTASNLNVDSNGGFLNYDGPKLPY